MNLHEDALARVPRWARWTAVVMLAVGAVLVSGGWEQQRPDLRRSLEDVVPDRFGEYLGQDVAISEAEQEVAGFTDYLMRVYEPPDEIADPSVVAAGTSAAGAAGSERDAEAGEGEASEAGGRAATVTVGSRWISTYVGYYDTQTRGRTIHSPKNCLPGSGWEALESRRATLDVPGGTVEVNRYLLQREGERALVLYWYQGRGRVVASEYRAKWDLLRDASLRRRSDEALVRIVVPIVESENAAFDLARRVAREVQPAVDRALPAI